MTVKGNGAEGGTNGTTVTTGNSGGSSGDPWSTVTIGGASTLTYDNAHPAHGALGYKVTSVANQAVYLSWSIVEGTQIFGRMYMYLTAAPGANFQIINHSLSGTSGVRIQFLLAGKFTLIDATGTSRGTTANSLSLNTQYRVEWSVTFSTTGGTISLSYYLGDSETPVETISASAVNTAASMDTLRIGITNAVNGVNSFWLDALSANTNAAIGPAVSSSAPSVSFTATAGAALPAQATASVAFTASPTSDALASVAGTASIDVSTSQDFDASAAATAIFELVASLTDARTSMAGSALFELVAALTDALASIAAAASIDVAASMSLDTKAGAFFELAATADATVQSGAAASIDLVATIAFTGQIGWPASFNLVASSPAVASIASAAAFQLSALLTVNTKATASISLVLTGSAIVTARGPASISLVLSGSAVALPRSTTTAAIALIAAIVSRPTTVAAGNASIAVTATNLLRPIGIVTNAGANFDLVASMAALYSAFMSAYVEFTTMADVVTGNILTAGAAVAYNIVWPGRTVRARPGRSPFAGGRAGRSQLGSSVAGSFSASAP